MKKKNKKIWKSILTLGLAVILMFGSVLPVFATETIAEFSWDKYDRTDEGDVLLEDVYDDNRLIFYTYVQTQNMQLMSNVANLSVVGYFEQPYSEIKADTQFMSAYLKLNPYNYKPVASLEHGEVWAIKVGLPNGNYYIEGLSSYGPRNAGLPKFDVYTKNLELSDRNIHEEGLDMDAIDSLENTGDLIKFAIYGSPEWIEENQKEFITWVKENDDLIHEINVVEESVENPVEESVTIEEVVEESEAEITITETEEVTEENEQSYSMIHNLIQWIQENTIVFIGVIIAIIALIIIRIRERNR